MKKIIILSAVLLSLSLSSCKKYLDIEPVGRVIPTTAEDFRALLNAGYAEFAQHKSLLAIRTDELVLNEFNDDFPTYRDIYKWNDINPDPLSIQFPYIQFYKTIFNANTVITDVEARAGVNAETAQLKGEAYLLRAYSHFELLNLYAKPYDKNTAATDRGIPLSLKVDLEHVYTPATVAAVYDQVIADITEGQKLLNVKTFEAGKNYRFTTRAALAFLARVREFRAEYPEALKASKEALALNNQLEDLNADGAVLPNNYMSKENIMSMESPLNNGVNRLARISAHLIGLYDQTGDLRFAKYYVKSGSNYTPLKGASEENKISFRNGELYLIQAEAALQTNDQALAVQSLLALKAKRLTPSFYTSEAARITALDKDALLQEIILERARELALEGHRWYDLRRYGQPQITRTVEGETFILQKNDPRYTIRFPKDAIDNNPGLQ